MPEKNSLIHYDLNQNERLESLVKELLKANVSALRIDPSQAGLSESEMGLIARLAKNKAGLVMVDDPDLAQKYNASAVFLTDPNTDLDALKENHPGLKWGGLARSLADCKNWELKGVDYLELIPDKLGPATKSPILGSEGFEEIIPKEEAYGWMLMSVNTPVLAAGDLTYKSLTNSVKHADIAGVVISDYFESKEKRETCLQKIRSVFESF